MTGHIHEYMAALMGQDGYLFKENTILGGFEMGWIWEEMTMVKTMHKFLKILILKNLYSMNLEKLKI